MRAPGPAARTSLASIACAVALPAARRRRNPKLTKPGLLNFRSSQFMVRLNEGTTA